MNYNFVLHTFRDVLPYKDWFCAYGAEGYELMSMARTPLHSIETWHLHSEYEDYGANSYYWNPLTPPPLAFKFNVIAAFNTVMPYAVLNKLPHMLNPGGLLIMYNATTELPQPLTPHLPIQQELLRFKAVYSDPELLAVGIK